jgi:hypothetical protein
MAGKKLELARFSLYVSLPVAVCAYYFLVPGSLDSLVKRVLVSLEFLIEQYNVIVAINICLKHKFVVYPPEESKERLEEEIRKRTQK